MIVVISMVQDVSHQISSKLPYIRLFSWLYNFRFIYYHLHIAKNDKQIKIITYMLHFRNFCDTRKKPNLIYAMAKVKNRCVKIFKLF